MIKAGQIGVGIIGKEGRQAVNNSDFAIGQFRFLRQLLLVHGRMNYRRLAVFTYYMFYINVALVMVLYIYSLTAAMSTGAYFLIPVFVNLFAVVYTPLPIIIYGSFNQDVPKFASALTARLYAGGIRRIYYTHSGFTGWMLEALLIGVVGAFIPMTTLGGWDGSLAATPDGDGSFDVLSFAAMYVLVMGVNLRLAMEVHSWSILEAVGYGLTLVVLLLTCLLFSFTQAPDSLPTAGKWTEYEGVMQKTWSMPAFWLGTLLALLVVMLPRFVSKARHALMAPSAAKAVKKQIRAEHQAEVAATVDKFKNKIGAEELAARRALLSQVKSARMELVTEEGSLGERVLSKFDGITQDERSVRHLWQGMGYFYEVGGGAGEDEYGTESEGLDAIPESPLRKPPKDTHKARVRVNTPSSQNGNM